MISLVILGKLSQQSTAPVAAKAVRSSWQVPVQNASLSEGQNLVKRQIQGGGSRFWQTTAPTTTANTLE
ncbi:hypothetical protein [Hymenobacter glacieicola]|uniref:Uncharacterized protein n=1 Tax=Hymenobacter glacieicola TaxID=1562124 RepID=A0ABQ1WXX4_9BACT|nr:hypothetical protein [Hymenobacter glacieicola]GGG46643.1 hypothetical protein GCM10011378_23540 [Hymenobacter glacieicola]